MSNESKSKPTANEKQPTDFNLPALYINRHLSNLQFNTRVLALALDENLPLLERLKFLLIFSSNLDEFFEIRVAGLKRQIEFSREKTDIDGMHPQEALREISKICHEKVTEQYQTLNKMLIPALQAENIYFLKRQDWTIEQEAWIENYFQEQILPIINPIGLDSAHPFPRLVNKSLNFIVALEGKDAFGRDSGLAIVPAPRSLPRIIRIPNNIINKNKQATNNIDSFVFLSSMIHAHADELFPGMIVKGCYQFRLTRNADVDILDVDEVKDLASALKGELLSRRYGDAVRLEVADNCPQEIISFLLQQFNLTEEELYKVDGPVNLNRLMALTQLVDRPNLLFNPFSPGLPKSLQKTKDIFAAMEQSDILLLHPYQSFTPVIDLLRQAAKDPNVLAIKQTLYRVGAKSEVVDALVEAARNRKEVTVIIEIRARFDEEENLELASRLQEAGAVVAYGVVDYKTHAKMMLIVRRKNNKLRHYVHLGTGNYHQGNVRMYTDYSLFSCDEALCKDIHKIFQQLTGMGKVLRVKKILHAPFTLHKKLIELIHIETENASIGKSAHIIVKVNALTESKLIKALYRASQAGVKIDLIIRGMCCLRPGMPSVSENITVRSIIGQFLEHSRVYYFHNDGDPKTFAASADWMERNINRRVETCFPIDDKKLAARIKRELDIYLHDNSQSWQLQNDGSYIRNKPVRQQKVRNAQKELLEKLAD